MMITNIIILLLFVLRAEWYIGIQEARLGWLAEINAVLRKVIGETSFFSIFPNILFFRSAPHTTRQSHFFSSLNYCQGFVNHLNVVLLPPLIIGSCYNNLHNVRPTRSFRQTLSVPLFFFVVLLVCFIFMQFRPIQGTVSSESSERQSCKLWGSDTLDQEILAKIS